MTTASIRGRDAELAALRPALLAPGCRLLTLTGPPGVGKSRLAAALTEEVSDRFPDGVVMVDVLGCASPQEALALLALRVGLAASSRVPGQRRVAELLRDRVALVVIDSCEAVPGLSTVVAGLLEDTRSVRVLATSQVRLKLALERLYAVPPLAMPSARATDAPWTRDELDLVAEVPAMAMLLDSTRRARPDFDLVPGNALHMVALCRQLEGVPLALEVAAARLAQFEPAALVTRLRDRDRPFDAPLAAVGRHRSLRAAISWSHDLLAGAEKRVFRRVAVFPGSWSPAAAAAVVGEPALDLVGCLEALVARNLVVRSGSQRAAETFTLLDSLRRFGREQLARAGETELVEGRFREYYAGVALGAEGAMGTLDETTAIAWGEGELVPLHAALESSFAAGDLPSALWLSSAVGWQWYTHGTLEGSDLVVDVAMRGWTELRHRGDLQEAVGASTLVAGVLSWARAEPEQALLLLTRARELSEQQRVPRRAAVAHAFLGHLARSGGALRTAEREAQTARQTFAQLGNHWGVAWAEHDLALVNLARGRLEAADELLRRAETVFDGAQDAWAGAWARSGRAEVAARRGDLSEAAALVEAALSVFLANGDSGRVAHCEALRAEIADASRPVDPLTPRQREVAARVALGATNRQIARAMGIADKTVEVHLSQIMGRIGVRNRAQVAGYAVRAGLELPGTD